ncbi:MAG: MogA/MoaB family molybdenum cofactor biosynthesis protein [Candidatus Hadarchaeales archaeon]
MGFEKHRKEAPKKLRVAVITISDSRYRAWLEGRDEDLSGKIMEERLKREGHEVVRDLVPDEPELILRVVKKHLEDPSVDVILTCGGTGITQRDVTVETIRPLLEKELPGFAERLRAMGYEMVGTPALLTRAIFGVTKGKFMGCLPGAPSSVEVGMKLLLPELGHLVKHARE